jgi:mRNA interferase RelE/StbE
MKRYEIRITKKAFRDIRELSPSTKEKLKDILIEVLSVTPNEGRMLVGELEGNISLRLNFKDRIVYSIDDKNKIVYIKRAKTHYGG